MTNLHVLEKQLEGQPKEVLYCRRQVSEKLSPDKREKERQRNRRYWAAHPEGKKAKNQRYRAAHREQIRTRDRALGRVRRLDGRHGAAYMRAYRARNLERSRELSSMDHVVPLSKGGATVKENIVPACPSCNLHKQARLPDKPVRLVLL
mgnify:CR=1 FL=1